LGLALALWASPIHAQQLDTVPYLLGRFDPAAHPAFAPVPAARANRAGMYLRRDALAAFARMADSAARDGVPLRIVSATRNFSAQQKLWEDKWMGRTQVAGRDLSTERDLEARARAVLTFSAMPGASRHHWGTDIDLNALTDSYFQRGEGARVYAWLRANASRFGFCQPYTPKGDARPTGHDEEKWHWSYRPVSQPLLAAYARRIVADSIRGFQGADQAGFVIREYVMGVDGACR
jgi:zinc D-Ala-D-Ala carboxypeptidase